MSNIVDQEFVLDVPIRDYKNDRFVQVATRRVRLQLRVDLDALALDMGSRATFSKGKKANSKDGIVKARVISEVETPYQEER